MYAKKKPELSFPCDTLKFMFIYEWMLSSYLLSHPGTVCLEWPQTVTEESSLYSITVKHGCRFSYQKKILERRLAVADGLSFVSFRRGSMPPTLKAT